jgi:hypothetical protein
MYWREYCQIVALCFVLLIALTFVFAMLFSGAMRQAAIMFIWMLAMLALSGSVTHMATRPWYYADYWKHPDEE